MPIFFFATTALTLTLMYVVLCNILSILHNTWVLWRHVVLLFFFCLFVFYFYSILIARRQLVSVLTLGETLSSREVSQQPPSTQCWVRTGWNFNFGWTTPFNEIECNMCVKHNAAHGHSFATTVCTRPRRALFSCQLGLRVHVVQSTHGQLRNAAPHGCPDANRLLQIS